MPCFFSSSTAGKTQRRRRSQRSGSGPFNDMDLTSEEESLFVAISFGKIHRISALLTKIEDVNIRSADQMTPLMHACNVTQGDLCSHIVRMFLKRKECDVNSRDENGRTALMYACQYKDNTDAGRILVRNSKTDTNLMDEDGWTALMHAIANNNFDAIEVLLVNERVACKVDVNLHNIEGSTALDMAVKYNSKKACQILVKHAHADLSQVHDRAKLTSLLGKT